MEDWLEKIVQQRRERDTIQARQESMELLKAQRVELESPAAWRSLVKTIERDVARYRELVPEARIEIETPTPTQIILRTVDLPVAMLGLSFDFKAASIRWSLKVLRDRTESFRSESEGVIRIRADEGARVYLEGDSRFRSIDDVSRFLLAPFLSV